MEAGDPIAFWKLCAPHGNRETRANNLSSTPRDSLFKKTFIPTNERKWIVIDANRSHGGDLSIHVSKMFTKMVCCHHNQDERE